MPCCLMVVAAFFPRVALFIMWLTGYGGRAFETILWPLLGFFFMPFTTCGYAIAMNAFGGVQGLGLALVIVGVVLDLGSHGGGAKTTTHYRRVRIEQR